MNIKNFCNDLKYSVFKKFDKKIQDIFYEYSIQSINKYKDDITNNYLYKSTSIIRYYNLLNKPFKKFLPIKVLTHNSNINSLVNILKTGILTNKELHDLNIEHRGYASILDDEEEEVEEGNQFIGTYVSPIINTNVKILEENFEIEENTNMMLLIDPYILNRDDWHINSSDVNGSLYKKTFTKDTIDLYFKSEHQLPELIFHNKIQPEFIKGIMIDKKDEKLVKNIINKHKYKINIYFKYKIKNDFYDDTMINIYKDVIGNSNYYPRFCMSRYAIDVTKDEMTPETYIKIALNCGMSEENVIKFLEKCKNDKTQKENCIRELLDFINQKYLIPNIVNNKYLYPIYEPPFNKEISNKKIIKLLDSLKSMFSKN
jgi:hypothetical protein